MSKIYHSINQIISSVERLKKYKHNFPKSHYLLFILFALSSNIVYGQMNDVVTDKQVDSLFSMYKTTTPGVAVVVIRDGKIIFKKGYGSANLEYNIPISTNTVFNIASVSKQFTAFAIYLLEKQGKLSLEDDIRKYIVEIPDYGKMVKIKHLLAHTSGIKDQWSLLTLAGWRMDDVITSSQIMRVISKQKELNFDPGSKYLYSNSGYTLLAEVIKRVSHKSFSEYMKENIFEPLKMNNSQFYDDYERIIKNRAESYELDNGVRKKKDLHLSADGATNLLTTVEDMAKWALNFENPIVGDTELIRRFNEPSLLNNGEKVVYTIVDGMDLYHAKGQNVGLHRGLKRLSFGGHQAAFRSSFWRFPDQRFAIVFLSNDEYFGQIGTINQVIELYLKKDLKPLITSTNPSHVNENKIAEKFNNILDDFEGKYYSHELETIYTAKVVNRKLILSHIRRGDVELIETGKDKFSGRIDFPVEIEVIRDKQGKVTGLKISNFGAKNIEFNRI